MAFIFEADGEISKPDVSIGAFPYLAVLRFCYTCLVEKMQGTHWLLSHWFDPGKRLYSLQVYSRSQQYKYCVWKFLQFQCIQLHLAWERLDLCTIWMAENMSVRWSNSSRVKHPEQNHSWFKVVEPIARWESTLLWKSRTLSTEWLVSFYRYRKDHHTD